MLHSKKSEIEMLKYLFKGEVPPSPRPLVSNSSWKVFCPFFVVAVFWQNCKSCQQWWLMKVFPPRKVSIFEGVLSCFCRVQSTLGSRRFRCNWDGAKDLLGPGFSIMLHFLQIEKDTQIKTPKKCFFWKG